MRKCSRVVRRLVCSPSCGMYSRGCASRGGPGRDASLCEQEFRIYITQIRRFLKGVRRLVRNDPQLSTCPYSSLSPNSQHAHTVSYLSILDMPIRLPDYHIKHTYMADMSPSMRAEHVSFQSEVCFRAFLAEILCSAFA